MKFNKQISKDKKRRQEVAKYAETRLLLKAALYNQLGYTDDTETFQHKLDTLPRNSSITRIKNRCVITGRGRAVYRDFKVSRIKLRELASFGKLAGIIKSV